MDMTLHQPPMTAEHRPTTPHTRETIMNTQTATDRPALTDSQALDNSTASANARASQSLRTVTPERTDALRRNAHPPSTLDRLAMRVGLALILWSRHRTRPRIDRDEQWSREAHQNRLERERRAREQAWLVAVDSLARR
jgi:hypothetical protein